MRWRWPVALAPGVLGALLAAAFYSAILPDPILFLRSDAGNLVLVLGLALSVLAACVLAAQLYSQRQAQRMRDQVQAQAAGERRRFVQRLDHELKNPLMAIEAGLANLAGEPAVAERGVIVQGIEAQAQRIGRLAADLRKLAELETRSLQVAPVDISDLLQEALDLARERAAGGERRLALTVPQAPWPLPVVAGDRDLLFLAVYNLLDNALKFSRAGDMIEVRAFEDRGGVVVEVADTGPGIPETEAQQVWEELYRGRAARGVPGSGLGLALVRAIAERHGGQVNLRSRENQGTVVTLRLPA